MSVGALPGASGGARGAQSQDFELNLASIIDCFTVLIAFMLASASFISIGILDAGVAAAGAQANPSAPPPVNLTVELKEQHQIQIKVTGKETKTITVLAKEGTWNFDEMSGHLKAFKEKWPAVSAATLAAENQIEYNDVIKSMELVRKNLPNVLLGGF